ncbi:MAG TPA: methylated-DNA--[protein]-cysteine S-methyltransferase [Actinomycetota bacterium]|nr:methylated-DNA--[protein]-cysteine S-methyltransferase [Actinomycetota bacterium]
MRDLERRLRGVGGMPQGAIERIAERAWDEVDGVVAYAGVDSPFGPLVVAATRRGIVRLAYPGEVDVVEELAERLTPRILEAPSKLDEARRELDDYFAGRRDSFDLSVDLSLVRGEFTRKVLRATSRIPFGRTLTYTEVASKAGSPRGSRAAGNALGSNPIPIVVPCHRVIHASGGLGGYTGGLDRKEFLLRLEGVLGESGYPSG